MAGQEEAAVSIMASKEHDVVAVLAADIASPRVVAAIDKALQENERIRLDLLDLRNMAVRRHGETPVEEPTSSPQSDAKEPSAPQAEFGDRLSDLARRYTLDDRSPYHQLRFKTREHYNVLLKRIVLDFGDRSLRNLTATDLETFHESWSANGKASMGHALMTMLRTIVYFGAAVLEDKDCERLSLFLRRMRLEAPKSRTERLTPDQAKRIILKAHEMGLHSIALAQALQLECPLSQKDIIGEWVPLSEPGDAHVVAGDEKWIRGLRWEEIDSSLRMQHIASNGGKVIDCSLRDAPLVFEEIKRLQPIPTKGPVIRSDLNDLPWSAAEFRRKWRKVARACGIPDQVKYMDIRSQQGDGQSN